MAGLRFEGVRFTVYSDDHEPAHVHGRYAGVTVIVDLLLQENAARLASRWNAVQPATAKRSDVKYILDIAARHFPELTSLWRKVHG